MFKNKYTRTRLSIGLLLIVGLAACASPATTPEEPIPVGTEFATLESVETTVTLPATSANFQEQVINAWYARDHQAFASFYSAPVILMGTQAPLENLDSADKLVASASSLIPDAPAGTPAAVTDPDVIMTQINYDPARHLQMASSPWSDRTARLRIGLSWSSSQPISYSESCWFQYNSHLSENANLAKVRNLRKVF